MPKTHISVCMWLSTLSLSTLDFMKLSAPAPGYIHTIHIVNARKMIYGTSSYRFMRKHQGIT